jgi:hypothetical protein
MKSVAAAFFCMFSLVCHAATTEYAYTGNKFNHFSYQSHPYGDVHPWRIFTENDSIEFTLTLSDAIPAGSRINISGNTLTFNGNTGPSPIELLSWSLESGPLKLSSSDVFTLSLDINLQGQVYDWNVEASNSAQNGFFGAGTIWLGVDTVIRTYYSSSLQRGADLAATCLGDATCLNAFGYPIGSTSAPGIWTISAVPETSKSVLFAIGILFIGGILKRKGMCAP